MSRLWTTSSKYSVQCLTGVAIASFSSLTVLPPPAIWSSVFPWKFENSAFVGVMWITCWHVYVLGGVCSVWPCNQKMKMRDVIASGTDTGNVWRMMLEHGNLLETLTLARASYTHVHMYGLGMRKGEGRGDICWGDNKLVVLGPRFSTSISSARTVV